MTLAVLKKMSYFYLFLVLFVNILEDGEAQQYEPDITKYTRDCVLMGFCASAPDYPNDLATELIRRKNEPTTTEQPPPVTTRPFRCEPFTDKVLPQAARSGNSWYFLLKHPYDRDIYATICKDTANPCTANSSYTCEQDYINMNILAMDWEGNILRDKYFQVPSECRCVFKHA